MNFLLSFLPLLVIVAIIAAIVVLVRRHSGVEDEPGIGTLRRLYYYGLAFVALMVSASGAVMLVDYVSDSFGGPEILSRGATQLAMAIALTVVATHMALPLDSGSESHQPIPFRSTRGQPESIPDCGARSFRRAGGLRADLVTTLAVRRR